MAHRLSGSVAHGIFRDKGLNSGPLPALAGGLSTVPPGKSGFIDFFRKLSFLFSVSFSLILAFFLLLALDLFCSSSVKLEG